MIGPRVKLFRKEKALSQQVFADLLSTSSGYISEIEKGKTTPGAKFFQSLKKAFPSANIEWLITGIGEMESRPSGTNQTATGNGHIQVGGNIQGTFISGGKRGQVKTVNETSAEYPNNVVKIEKVLKILEDYMAPKIIKEIEEKLKKEV